MCALPSPAAAFAETHGSLLSPQRPGLRHVQRFVVVAGLKLTLAWGVVKQEAGEEATLSHRPLVVLEEVELLRTSVG